MKFNKLNSHRLPRPSKNIHSRSPLRRKIHRRSRPRRQFLRTEKNPPAKLPVRRNAVPSFKIPPQNNRHDIDSVNVSVKRRPDLEKRPYFPQHFEIPAQPPGPMIVRKHAPQPHSAQEKTRVRVVSIAKPAAKKSANLPRAIMNGLRRQALEILHRLRQASGSRRRRSTGRLPPRSSRNAKQQSKNHRAT